MADYVYNLADLTRRLARAFPDITAMHLFGSRRFRTGSPRSDIDVLVEVIEGTRIRPQELRAFTDAECPALDLFIVDGSKAVSSANESWVEADTIDDLVTQLGAIQFWNRTDGLLEADIEWELTLPVGVDFIPTAIIPSGPIPESWRPSLRAHMSEVEASGLPTQPYLGSTPAQVAAFVVEATRRLLVAADSLSPRGRGWRVDLRTEYDFQNLFHLVLKPWLPELGREEVSVRYDGQDKTADFNLFGNQIIIEMKHIRDAGTKAAVAKTVEGLGEFYLNHPNVRIALFAILADADVDLDDAKWEADFSHTQRQPQVWTRVFRPS